MSETPDDESSDATPSRRISPREYFEELRIALACMATIKTIHEAEHPGEPLPERPWPRIDRFEARKWLGAGGFGAVVVARDPELDRFVALKLCPGIQEKAEEKFRHEAQLVAKLRHPNIITIFEFGRHGDDFFYVMEYFDGGDVDRMLDTKDPNLAEVIETYCLAGEGLAAAHERVPPIVHGDFKPSNVLVSDDGERVCVADFGLARVIDETDEAARPGSSSYRAGTIDYMAPELLQRGGPTAMSDQWAFCVSVWESLFGVYPFAAGDDADAMLASIARGIHVPKVRDGPATEVVKAMLRGLSIDPVDRYPNMLALVAALRSAMATVPGPFRRGGRWVYPVALALTLAGGLGALAWDHRRSPSPIAEAPPQPDRGSPRPDAAGRTFETDIGTSADERSIHLEQDEDASATESGDAKPKDEDASLREQARLQKKYDAWAAKTRVADLSGEEAGQQLATAREFYDDAVKLEKSDRASACVAAKHAEDIAGWISRSTSTDADEASTLRDSATSMVGTIKCETLEP